MLNEPGHAVDGASRSELATKGNPLSLLPGQRPGRASRAIRTSIVHAGIILALSWPITAGADGDPDPTRPIVFRDVAEEAGVSFRFYNGSRGKHDLPEVMGGGVAVFDADGDGRLDLYLCNGGPIEATPGGIDPPSRLYCNRGNMQFDDVTALAAAPGPSYAMGAAVGDFDADGRLDLFVTGWRDQRLYRNLGAGRFEDVTARSGLVSRLWSTSAAFADLDGDGDLDLYVAMYLDYDAGSPPYCTAPDGRRDYCGPESFPRSPIGCTAITATVPSPMSRGSQESTSQAVVDSESLSPSLLATTVRTSMWRTTERRAGCSPIEGTCSSRRSAKSQGWLATDGDKHSPAWESPRAT